LAAIALEGVSKAWGESKGVDRISFTTHAGQFLVLLGPLGCGKSTTLRLIAGLEQADAGRIYIAGDDVSALPPSLRQLSMVFQSYALFRHLSVAENILFGLKVRKATAADQRRGLARVAELLGLQILLKVYVPFAKPVYLAFALVSVSFHWNNFLWPLVVTNSVHSRPLTVGLQVFASVDQGIDWSIITAATIMTTAPLLIAFLLFQRQFVQSFMRAGIR
jgi:hypothetical protein